MMQTRVGRSFSLLFLFAASLAPAPMAWANTMSVKLTLSGLPSTITLCRVPSAIAVFQVDEQWLIPINVDANVSTGDASGIDVELIVETMQQSSGCTPTSASTMSALVAGVIVWDPLTQNFVNSEQVAILSLDFVANTLTITTDLSGVLASLSPQSLIYAGSFATYTPTSQPATYAFDKAGPIHVGDSIVSLPNNVMQCTSPCSPASSYYPLIDIVGVAITTGVPLDAFGSKTLTVEFELAALPANLSLCRYPALFAYSGGNDYLWLALFDTDGNVNTGQPGNGSDAQIVVHSTGQTQGCSTNSAPVGQALSAELDQWNDAQQNFVFVGNVPVTVDRSRGKIIVQADRTLAGLTSLSAHSVLFELTAGHYNSGSSPYALNASQPFVLGTSFADAEGNVSNCSLPCATTVDWYPQIDLVGGSIYLADEIFHAGFE